MNTKTKLAAIALTCLIPLAAVAYDKFEDDDHDRDDHKKSSYFEHDERGLSQEFLSQRGTNLVFEGNVEKKPAKGFNGIWVISGYEVMVDDDTTIFMEDGIRVNEEVEVLAKRENGQIKALFLEMD